MGACTEIGSGESGCRYTTSPGLHTEGTGARQSSTWIKATSRRRERCGVVPGDTRARAGRAGAAGPGGPSLWLRFGGERYRHPPTERQMFP